jgi:hypothetical protein
MSVATFEAVIENGQVRLPRGVRLPENAVVYVVVPDFPVAGVEQEVTLPANPRVASPRLKHPEQAADFVLEVVEDSGRAGLR